MIKVGLSVRQIRFSLFYNLTELLKEKKMCVTPSKAALLPQD